MKRIVIAVILAAALLLALAGSALAYNDEDTYYCRGYCQSLQGGQGVTPGYPQGPSGPSGYSCH